MMPVDVAMEAGRPEKETMRGIWCDLVADHVDEHDVTTSPLYVTLCGSEGRDIELLIARGLLRVTEVGAIVEEHAMRVVAIESRLQAIARIKAKFPGLRVIDQPIQSIVAGMDLTRWPGASHERTCRGLIINLDLNGSLQATTHAGQPVFPIIRWVEKIARLHTQDPPIDWWLCLTLNAAIEWSDPIEAAVRSFLGENFALDPDFEEHARHHLGAELFELVTGATAFTMSELTAESRQRLLMTLVPKRLARDVVEQGWRLETSRNLRYGGFGTSAAMVTWIFRFSRDERAFATPQQVYKESLASIHSEVGAIATDGTL